MDRLTALQFDCNGWLPYLAQLSVFTEAVVNDIFKENVDL